MRSRLLSILQSLVIGVVIAVAAALAVAVLGVGAWMTLRWVRKRFAAR